MPARVPLPPVEPDATLVEGRQVRLPMTSRSDGYRLPALELLRRAPASAADARDTQHTMAALEVASPQAAAEAVLRRVRNSDHFGFVLESRDRNERSEHLFLADTIAGVCRDNRRLDIATGLERRIDWRLAAS